MVTYFIQMGEYVKIGRTKNLHFRIRALKTGFPLDLVILAVSDIPEKEAHKIASTMTKRRNGEWFELNLPISAWIKSLPITTTEWASYKYIASKPRIKRKRSTIKIRRNISITKWVAKEAQKVAKEQGMSLSSWIEKLIIQELAKNKLKICA